LKNVCYKVSLFENRQLQVIRPIYSCKYGSQGTSLYYVKIWPNLTHPYKSTDFQSIFASNASAVTHSEKKFSKHE